MASKGKRRGRKRRKQCKHPCECGWRVNWTAEFRRRAQELGVWEDIRRELKDLEKRLRSREERQATLDFLILQPIVGYYPYHWKRYNARRMRLGGYRLFYVVRQDICRVWFVEIAPRTDSTYARARRGA